ncbi:MAG: branched-chain amino acid ABC transporter permease [Firmicutes bacterium]|nr:branched-chain amino acid ABC transporter permease [Bacillota bacterium]
MKTKKKKITKILIILAATVLFCFLPQLCSLVDGGPYLLNVVNYIFVYVIATVGLNIMTGYSGQINLGGAAYFSVGAYATVILNNAGLGIFLSVVVAMLITAVFGFMTAIPAAKLKFHFLALATMAVGEIVNNFIKVSPGKITNDTSGLFVKAMVVFGIKLKNDQMLFYFLMVMTLLSYVVAWAFINSKTGRACIATRDSVDAAGSCGIDVRKYKIIATVTSCIFLGFAGFLFAYLNRYISPDTFAAGKSTMFMSMMMLGGSGTLYGPILGTVLVTIIMEVLRGIPGSGAYLQMSYGIILLVIMMFLPQGLSGLIADIKFKRYRKELESQEGGTDA